MTSRIVAIIFALLLVCVGQVIRFSYGWRGSRVSRKYRNYNVVQHGSVLRPDQLKGHGTLYFIPMGEQDFPVSTLLDHYRQKFGLEITALPAVTLDKSWCSGLLRKQCVAEEMILGALHAYPAVEADPDSVVLVLTNVDISSASMNLDWTYGFHFRRRFGIVSSYRPSIYERTPAARLASTEQQLTKYIGYMYYHLQLNHDPSSVMHHPLTPNGGNDDLYESDLEPEYSANGRWVDDNACVGFRYSWKTGVFTPLSGSILNCTDVAGDLRTTDDEIFRDEILGGQFVVRAMDIDALSDPALQLQRGHVNRVPLVGSFGVGSLSNFDEFFSEEGTDKRPFILLNHEDGSNDRFARVDGGLGLREPFVFVQSAEFRAYMARVTNENGGLRITYHDGAVAMLARMPNGDNFLTDYRDSHGRTLTVERGPRHELMSVGWSVGGKIAFTTDERKRVTSASDGAGHRVRYEYDERGDLVKVFRSDGRIAIYTYNNDHNLTSFSAIRNPGEAPSLLLTNEYGTDGRIVRQTLADGQTFQVKFFFPKDDGLHYHSTVIDPSGRELNVVMDSDQGGGRFWARPVRYPYVGSGSPGGSTLVNIENTR